MNSASPLPNLRDRFIEVDHWQAAKHRQPVSGDVFLSRKTGTDDRLVSVLSDGLGSGIKASVLATLTSTMALHFVAAESDIRRGAATIMAILPVCSERRIGYSTFTIVDVDAENNVRIIEHDNPAYLVIRDGQCVDPPKQAQIVPALTPDTDPRVIEFSTFAAEFGDRVIFFSDGVSQSGMGRQTMPLGWGLNAVTAFALTLINANPSISARELARGIVQKAANNDRGEPKDDITCGVIYFRRPRHLLIATGPPFAREGDAQMAAEIRDFPGTTVLCGGTTANIVARELRRTLTVDLDELDPDVPPTSRMAGINLITEGTITLAKVVELLESGRNPDDLPANGATRLVQMLLNSDIIHFLVGTRINDAHQDPNVPVELDIRRNIVRRIRRLLEEGHIKETSLRFV